MAKYCPECNIEVGDDDKVCGTCGYVLEKTTNGDNLFTGGAFKEENNSKDFVSKGYISVESVSDENLSKEIVADEIIADSVSSSDSDSGNATSVKPPIVAKTSMVAESSPKVMSLGDWMITLLLLLIPIVNIVMLIVWSVDSNTNENKKHFAWAYLIYMAIGIVLSIIFSSILVSVILASLGSMAY